MKSKQPRSLGPSPEQRVDHFETLLLRDRGKAIKIYDICD